MNTYNRSQGMDNRLNMLFNQELDNEAQYIKSHPFSSINMSLGGEVRYIAPIWPWNAPRFQAIDWRTQPPPRKIPGNTKHDQGKRFVLPKTWNETTNMCWSNEEKPPACFPYAPPGSQGGVGGNVIMTAGARRSATNTPASRAPPSQGGPRDDADPAMDPAMDSAAFAADPPPLHATDALAPEPHTSSRPPTHPRLPSGAVRSRPDSHGGGPPSRGGSNTFGAVSGLDPTRPMSERDGGGGGSRPRSHASDGSRPPTNASRPPTNGSRPPTNASGARRWSGGAGGGSGGRDGAPPVEPLRLDVPVSMLPGRPKTNASNPRLSVRSNGSARRAAQEVVNN